MTAPPGRRAATGTGMGAGMGMMADEMSLVAGALRSERAQSERAQQDSGSGSGGGVAQMPETVSRSEYTAMLARIDAKLDKLDTLATDVASLRSSLPTRTEFEAALALHVRRDEFVAEIKRIDARWGDGMADIDTRRKEGLEAIDARFAKLEGSPQRALSYVTVVVAALALLISAVWVVIWIAQHAGTGVPGH